MHIKILMRFQKPLVPIKYVKQLSWLCGLWAAHDIDIIELLQTKKIGDSIFCTVYKSIYFLSRYVFWLLVRKIDKMRFYQRRKIQWRLYFRKKNTENLESYHLWNWKWCMYKLWREQNVHCVTKVQYSILWGGGSKVNNKRLQTPIWYYRISEELLAEFYLMSTDFSKCVFKTLGWVGSYFCNTESAVIREAENPVNFIENGQSDTYLWTLQGNSYLTGIFYNF